LDVGQSGFLNAKNMSDQHGDLVVEPVCMHSVTQSDAVAACKGYISPSKIPPVGSHVKVTGSFVLYTAHGWLELHLISSIGIVYGGGKG
jgi:hypothetical protein